MPRTLLPSLVLALAAGCASTAGEPLSPMQPLGAAEFAGAAGLLHGFTAPVLRNEWRLGESILYGLRLEKGSAVQRWLVRLTLADNTPGDITSLDLGVADGEPINFMSPNYVYRVEVCDGDGGPLGDSRVAVPYDFLRYDFTIACADARDPPLDQWKRQRIAGAYAALISFLRILQADDLLSGILWQVVDKPSFWSVLGNLGVSVSLSAELKDAIDLASPLPSPWSLAAVRFPLVLRVNGTDALHVEITATSPHVPMRMGAGIVQIRGTRPSDPRVRFAATVLAARSP